MRKLKCSICGYIYDEASGIPENGIAPGTKWEDIPDSFTCPVCTAPKSVFMPLDPEPAVPALASAVPEAPASSRTAESAHDEKFTQLPDGVISAICSNLAKGCEKQRLLTEMDAFNKIADFYKAKAKTAEDGNKTLADSAKLLGGDLLSGFTRANAAAAAASDRGALRSLVWSEKVSAMLNALLERFAREGESMLENTKIYVCDICGFVIIGEPPEICPVCKVPNFKIMQVEV